MKTASLLKISICCLLGVILVACKEYEPPTSHFGTGTHRCYYQNERTGQFHPGIADKKEYAVRYARTTCKKAAAYDKDKENCSFAECRFK
ncbi:MAG: hypothetical protein A3F13_02050 [Gammaproteobacteria bacterium RIFCSPHIGHO2_12_FULL_40_19]|nr:MAG: hypothetical protein A3F13_02050 [Gammaproteobacteria bacterium RIFCSPHIGHO2_12_FULL_40_19]